MVSWYDIFEPKVADWEAGRDLPRLIAGLSNPDPEIRCLVYDALGRMQLQESCKEICQALKRETSSSVRSRAAVALGRLGGTESTLTLFDLLNDRDGDVRAAATRGLGRLTKQQNIDLLSVFCALLDDENESVVVEAIYALSQFGHHRAVTPLHRLFDHCERPIRELASSAINSINLNQPLGWPSDDVYFFTYARRGQLFCECYSYRLVAWRNYLRRRWQYPFARKWGVGYWEMSSLAERLREEVLPPGLKLSICDRRA